MLGVYMQRSWVILVTTACFLVPVYVFSPPILKLFGESDEISAAAGAFSITFPLPTAFNFVLFHWVDDD